MKIRGNTVGTSLKPEKAIVKATNLTDEQKAQVRENIGAVSQAEIGDINDALDSIIAIQNQLIGGDGV